MFGRGSFERMGRLLRREVPSQEGEKDREDALRDAADYADAQDADTQDEVTRLMDVPSELLGDPDEISDTSLEILVRDTLTPAEQARRDEFEALPSVNSSKRVEAAMEQYCQRMAAAAHEGFAEVLVDEDVLAAVEGVTSGPDVIANALNTDTEIGEALFQADLGSDPDVLDALENPRRVVFHTLVDEYCRQEGIRPDDPICHDLDTIARGPVEKLPGSRDELVEALRKPRRARLFEGYAPSQPRDRRSTGRMYTVQDRDVVYQREERDASPQGSLASDIERYRAAYPNLRPQRVQPVTNVEQRDPDNVVPYSWLEAPRVQEELSPEEIRDLGITS